MCKKGWIIQFFDIYNRVDNYDVRDPLLNMFLLISSLLSKKSNINEKNPKAVVWWYKNTLK